MYRLSDRMGGSVGTSTENGTPGFDHRSRPAQSMGSFHTRRNLSFLISSGFSRYHSAILKIASWPINVLNWHDGVLGYKHVCIDNKMYKI